MDFEIPETVVSNLDIIVKYQNSQLLRKIAEWYKIDPDKLVTLFIPKE